MPDQLQLRGGTTTEHNSFTGALREVTVDTTKKTVVVHDGSQAGGTPLMRESGSNAASSVQIGSGGVNALTIDGSQDITLTGASANVVWDKSDNAFEFADNAKAVFGIGSDLEIYHDGTHSHIVEKGGGNLALHTNSGGEIQLAKNDSGQYENMLRAIPDGAVVLAYDNSTKFETTSTGIKVDQILNLDGSTPRVQMRPTGNEQSHRIEFYNAADSMVARIFGDPSTGNLSLQTGGNGVEEAVKCIANGAVELYHNNVKKFETTSYGTLITGECRASSSFQLLDNGLLKLGSSDDFRILHDASNTFIQNDTGNLVLAANRGGDVGGQIWIDALNGERSAKFYANAQVELFYNGTKRFETTSEGALFSGAVGINGTNLTHAVNTLKIGHEGGGVHQLRAYGPDTSTNGKIQLRSSRSDGTNSFTITYDGNLSFPDNQKATFGTGDDLKIYHDGSNSYLDNRTGNLVLMANTTDIGARIIPNGSTELYYDNSKKLDTTADGIVVRKLYQQEASNSTAVVYARQCFRDSIGANATRTITLSGVIYGNATISIGYSDGNFHFVTFKATMGGAMYSISNGYTVTEQLNSRNGVSSITATKNNANYVVTIVAGTNQVYGSIVVESHNYDNNSKPTVTLS